MSARPFQGSGQRVSVVIAAFDEDRWPLTQKAIESVGAQSLPVQEVILVIDHNPTLYARAREHFRGVRVIENTETRGASGARNTGTRAASGELVAFLDDDVAADPDWLAESVDHFQSTEVVGVGGKIVPVWEKQRPYWFPEEMLWAVGVSYRGMPESTSQVRNVWTSNMVVRREAFERVGGFRVDFGKLGDREDFQAEDTEFCLRASRAWPGGQWIYEPRAVGGHLVPARRSSWKFLVARCYHEGRNKVIMSRVLGADTTSRERGYALRVVPRGVLAGLKDALRGDLSGLARSATLVCCVVAAAVSAARESSQRRATTAPIATPSPTLPARRPAA